MACEAVHASQWIPEATGKATTHALLVDSLLLLGGAASTANVFVNVGRTVQESSEVSVMLQTLASAPSNLKFQVPTLATHRAAHHAGESDLAEAGPIAPIGPRPIFCLPVSARQR